MSREQRDYIGHAGTPAPVSPPAAPAVAGEQYSSHTLTTGTYRVYAASIHTTNPYEEECRISLVHTGSDGTTTEACLASGIVSQNKPFSLPASRIVTGSGSLRAYVTNLDATAFSFYAIVDKIVEAKESIGGFGGWF